MIKRVLDEPVDLGLSLPKNVSLELKKEYMTLESLFVKKLTIVL